MPGMRQSNILSNQLQYLTSVKLLFGHETSFNSLKNKTEVNIRVACMKIDYENFSGVFKNVIFSSQSIEQVECKVLAFIVF